MNMLIEYLLDMDLVNDPFLYSFYVSLFLSVAFNRVWGSLVDDAASLFSKDWSTKQTSIQLPSHMNRGVKPTDHFVSWFCKTIGRQESSPDDEDYLNNRLLTL